MKSPSPVNRRSLLSFLYAVPIGTLGGLMGLGGAEFRLPVLAGPLGYSPRQAVPLNLAVSLVTVISSLAIRSRTLSFTPLIPYLPDLLSLIAGAVITAFWGARVAGKLSNEQLERMILVLLVTIGAALIVEGFLPQRLPGFLPPILGWRIGAGIGFGLAIGLVSSLLGVAGGEIIIPTLIFAFGLEIKTAGSSSLWVSLPTVLMGVVQYARRGAFSQPEDLRNTVFPMGIGSVIGAVIGGLLVGFIPSSALKISLGVILNLSAWKVFKRHHASAS